MDFDSEYVLEEEEEEEDEPEPMPRVERPSRPQRYFEDNTSGFECEIMEFEDDDETSQAAPKEKKEKKVDPNTVSLTMTSLAEKSDRILHKNQLAFCDNKDCEAAFSYLDKGEPKPGENGKNVWICKFCGHHNYPELAEGVTLTELTPEESDVLYLDDVEKEPNMKPTDKGNFKIIFVIDTSASMCQTSQVKQSDADDTLKDIVRKERELNQQMMMGMHGGDNQMIQQLMQQMMPGFQMPTGMGMMPALQGQQPSEDHIEVTRLQFIKAAVIKQIEKLKADDPSRRVGLVAFNEKVVVYGDGNRDKIVTVEGGQLIDKNELQMVGQDHIELRPISESADNLIEIIKNLKEEGRTALGPALVIAQEMITVTESRGSKIILCTDGFANIGLGRLEESTDVDIQKFYDGVIGIGKMKAMSVSIICCDDAGIRTRLGDVPEETGGMLEKIKAEKFTNLLCEELSRQTVATHAEIKFVVHKDMYVKDTKHEDVMSSKFSNLIGNIRQEKRVPFAFAVRPQQKKDDQAPKDNSSCSCPSSSSQDDKGTATSATPASDATTSSAPPATPSTPASDGTTPTPAPSDTTPMDTSTPSASQSSGDAGAPSTSMPPLAEEGKPLCPFQVQIIYTDMAGVRARRIWTKEKKVTKNREVAEKAINTGSALTTFYQKSSEILLSEKSDSERRQKAVDILGEIETWMKKYKNTEKDQFKKLSDFQDLITEVANKPYTDDLSASLRNFKEARPVAAQA